MSIETPRVTRREFLRAGAIAGVGLLVGFTWPGCARADADNPGKPSSKDFTPNAFLSISPAGDVTVMIPKSEMGQGVLTSLAMIVAEELDVAWERVRSVEAPAAAPYRLGILGQLTAGSDSVRGTWDPMREAGAAARGMLVAAAAAAWNVAPEACRTEKGVVYHDASKRQTAYGELVMEAGKHRGGKVKLKDPQQYRILGTRIARVDSPQKVNGQAVYGVDVKLPGLLTACIARCPVFGGKVRSFDATKALALPGVRHVVPTHNGVAVAADHYWAARKGVEALVIQWDEGPGASYSTAEQRRSFEALARAHGRESFTHGDAVGQLHQAGDKAFEALYELPFLAHMTMEPQNSTVRFEGGKCEVWAGTQAQTACQKAAAGVFGLSDDDVIVHTTFLGGGFGRRAEPDMVVEAAEVAKATGKPIKVLWNRADDIHHDFFRPANTHFVQATLGADGFPSAWKHHVVAPSVLARILPAPVYWILHDPITSEGLDKDNPYSFPHAHVEVTDVETPVPVGWWRSVGFGHNVYVLEHLVDELAHLGGKDPLEVRRKLVSEPRVSNVMERAAAKAGWGKPLPKGHFHGIAVASPFGSHVAQVAEVSIEDDEVVVHRVVCVVDCGQTINPAIIEAQMESGILFGLSMALYGEVTIEKGRVVQNNFDTYQVARLRQMPRVEVEIVQSTERPGGIGEVGVPCLAPAVANALLAATGKAHRRLPFTL